MQTEQGSHLKQIDQLKPYPKNARIHTKEQINQVANSIKEFGFTNPVLYGKDNVIIAGHCRVLAAKQLGLTEIPAIDLSRLTKAQAQAYVIADNQLALNAGWEHNFLTDELNELNDLGFDLNLLGFSQDSLDALLNPEKEIELSDSDNEIPDVPTEPITKLGDVWLLGEHRLMCGDSTSITDVEKLMDGQAADLLLTDPPYNVDYTGKTKDALKINNDAMPADDFRKFLAGVFINASIVMRDGAVFYIWHADLESYNFRGACADANLTVRQCLVWVKNTLVMGRQDYHWKHEPCLYGWKDGAAHFWASDRTQTTTLLFDRPTKSDLHPTMKPIELMVYQVCNNTKPAEKVLDLFGGSGTTLIACEKAKRKCLMMELDPKYCDVIISRWEKLTGQKATLEAQIG